MLISISNCIIWYTLLKKVGMISDQSPR